jgi:hypothetical protein
MTRIEVAVKLLALGPLTPREFREIAGWPQEQCRNTLRWLAETRRVYRCNGGRWGLAKEAQA